MKSSIIVLLIGFILLFFAKWKTICSWYRKNFPVNLYVDIFISLTVTVGVVGVLRELIRPETRSVVFQFVNFNGIVDIGIGFVLGAFVSLCVVLRKIYFYHRTDYRRESILEPYRASTPDTYPVSTFAKFLKTTGMNKEEFYTSPIFKRYREKLNTLQEFLRYGAGGILTINGRWRSGKTSFLNIGLTDEEYIKNEDSAGHLFIRESAISYDNSPESFIDDIVNQVAEAVRKNWGVEIGSMINAVSRNLGKRELGFIDNILQRTNPHHKVLSGKLIKEINAKIDQHRKPEELLFIIIDDLDRLNGDELRHTFAILAMLKDLKFLKLIVLIDRDAIRASLDGTGIYRPDEYINKFVPISEKQSIYLESGYEMFKEIAFRKFKKALRDKNNSNILESVSLDPVWATCLLDMIDRKAQNLKTDRAVSPTFAFNPKVGQRDKIPSDILNYFEGTPFFSARNFLALLYEQIRKTKSSDELKKFNWRLKSIDNFWFFGNKIEINKLDKDEDKKDIEPYENIIKPTIFPYADVHWYQLGRNAFDELNRFCSLIKDLELTEEDCESDESLFKKVYNHIADKRLRNIGGVVFDPQ